MKRGFHNTDEAERKLATDSDIPNDHTLDKDKGKAGAETVPDATKSYPPLLDLHSVSPSVRSVMQYPTGKNRFVFRHWPRDPNGKSILSSDIHGKEAANGLKLWGATLYDFYFVRRTPSGVHVPTISTGSKLAKVMEAFGELEHAQNEIAWATREAEPKEIPAWDPAQAIVAHERHVHARAGVVDKMDEKSAHPEVSAVALEADAKKRNVSEPVTSQAIGPKNGAIEVAEDLVSKDSENKPSGETTVPMDIVGMQQFLPDISVESPFHPSHYPSPWPLVPFESSCPPFSLQRGMPIHLLPKKLYVHDPWKLVHIKPNISCEGKESQTSKTDHIHTYALSLPPESQKMAEAASKAAAEDKTLRIPETIFISPRETEGPTEQPAIRAFLPKRPRKPTETPEAHLYLSPKHVLGTGNHSIVYEAELELPRDIFCESTYCKACLDEQIKVEVDRLKESGEWEQHLDKAAKTYKGPRGYDAASHHSSSSPFVQIPPRYVGFVEVRLEHVPMQTVDMVSATGLGETPAEDAPSQHFARVSDPVINRSFEYQGLVVPVHPNIQWQNPSFPDTICEHQTERMKPVPRTARFLVAAKMSLPYDPHLKREANNYLKFPTHFFQHWNGYNVIPPLSDPTPVGALVPQFFGHYMPDGPSNSHGESAYCSPILLIEHCGKPISIDELSIDDRYECVSLLFRFHAAGWLHESFAERNILMQKQHPTCSPLKEDDHQCDIPHQHRRYSFRLIDFGRSVKYEQPSCSSIKEIEESEEIKGKYLFGLF